MNPDESKKNHDALRRAWWIFISALVLTFAAVLLVWQSKIEESPSDLHTHYGIIHSQRNIAIENSPVKSYEGKKVLEIDSYHDEFSWTFNITKSVQEILEPAGVDFKVIRMDAKRNPEMSHIEKAVQHAKEVISEYDPDVIIISDDAAAKYLIAPYYNNTDLPVVFCGINWDASIYDFPSDNVTGMIEVDHIEQILELLSHYSRGSRLGILLSNELTEHKTIEYYQKVFGIEFDRIVFADTYDQWKEGFIDLQNNTDMMIVGNFMRIADFDLLDAERFVLENVQIPSGTYGEECTSISLLGVVKDPKELGTWSAQTALKILDGTPPSEIPVTYNRNGILYLNMNIAEKLGIIFQMPLLKKANIIRLPMENG